MFLIEYKMFLIEYLMLLHFTLLIAIILGGDNIRSIIMALINIIMIIMLYTTNNYYVLTL